MKRLAVYAVVMLAALFVTSMFTGCALFQQKGGTGISLAGRVVQAEEVYTSTLRVLTAAVESGVISKQTAKDQIEPVRATAAAALEAMKQIAGPVAAASRSPSSSEAASFDLQEKRFKSALDPLIARRFQIERRE